VFLESTIGEYCKERKFRVTTKFMSERKSSTVEEQRRPVLIKGERLPSLGELDSVNLICVILLHDSMYVWMFQCCLTRVIACFWNFSKNCLAGLQSRQATHLIVLSFWDFLRNRLATRTGCQATQLFSPNFWASTDSSKIDSTLAFWRF